MIDSREFPVCICVITYNHEAYIAKTLKSIIVQQTNFKYQIVIGEDSSTDGTRAICEQYANKYPDIINLLPSDRNYGMMPNFLRTLYACDSIYTALCEGDDYWVDPYKLQKQVDLLDSDPNASFCFTKSYIIDENGKRNGDNVPIPVKDTYNYKDILNAARTFIPTATFIFRNKLPNPIPQFFSEAMSGDIALHLIMLSQGYGLCIFEETAVYRIHQGGITKSAEHIEHAMAKLLVLYEQANEYFEFKYNSDFRDALGSLSNTLLIYGAKDKKGFRRMKHALKYFPIYLKYQPEISVKNIIYYSLILFAPQILKFKK